MNGETCNARSDDAFVHDRFLCPGVSLRQGLPEVEVALMHIDVITVIALILSILLLGYLALTLLFPEKF
jgi:K+-transporting ATPase KdpF subunit